MKIDKNIPVIKNTGHLVDLWKNLKIGDSVFFDNITQSQATGKGLTAKSYFTRNKIEVKITVRKDGTGFRIWRIA